ncbi:MAG: hypothetical protein K2W82_18475 [Candidatus Obscuribacterales bacterium]|nr:hypothetical protein [Candidatus Obscuribacterales bacterium]
MLKCFKRIVPLSLASVVSIACGLNHYALSLPGTGAPVAASHKVAIDDKDAGNPFVCPFFLDLVRSLARNGLPPGFFLGGEGKPAASGLDLRAILLYEAGVLKAPVRLLMPGRSGQEVRFSLSMPALPETEPTKLGQSSEQTKPALGKGEQSTVQKLSTPSALGPALSLDLSKFHEPSLEQTKDKGESSLPVIASAQSPLGDKNVPSPLLNSFRLWTVSEDTERYEKPRSDQALAVRKEPFQGSFLVVVPGAINSVEGRTFSVKKGPLLAFAKGKLLNVETPQGRIGLLPGTCCLVDFTEADALRIRVIESSESTFGAGVKFEVDGKMEEVRLSKGDQFVLSSAQNGGRWTKTQFSPAALLANEAFVQSGKFKGDPELQAVIDQLRMRLK